MKKLVFAAMLAIAGVASVSAQNMLGYSDVQHQREKHQTTDYLDGVVCAIPGDSVTYMPHDMAKHGVFLGLGFNMQDFDSHCTPAGGIVGGWEGGKKFPLKIQGEFSFTTGYYTEEAYSKGDKYREFDTRISIAICPFISKNKQWRVWVGPYMDYKFSADDHKNENVKTVVKETEYEVVTTTDKWYSQYQVKANSLGGGIYGGVRFTPEFSRLSFELDGGIGLQQKFYDDGNRFKMQWFVGINILYNIFVYEYVDKAFLKMTGLSKKQLRKASKKNATYTTQWGAR